MKYSLQHTIDTFPTALTAKLCFIEEVIFLKDLLASNTFQVSWIPGSDFCVLWFPIYSVLPSVCPELWSLCLSVAWCLHFSINMSHHALLPASSDNVIFMFRHSFLIQKAGLEWQQKEVHLSGLSEIVTVQKKYTLLTSSIRKFTGLQNPYILKLLDSSRFLDCKFLYSTAS